MHVLSHECFMALMCSHTVRLGAVGCVTVILSTNQCKACVAPTFWNPYRPLVTPTEEYQKIGTANCGSARLFWDPPTFGGGNANHLVAPTASLGGNTPLNSAGEGCPSNSNLRQTPSSFILFCCRVAYFLTYRTI